MSAETAPRRAPDRHVTKGPRHAENHRPRVKPGGPGDPCPNSCDQTFGLNRDLTEESGGLAYDNAFAWLEPMLRGAVEQSQCILGRRFHGFTDKRHTKHLQRHPWPSRERLALAILPAF